MKSVQNHHFLPALFIISLVGLISGSSAIIGQISPFTAPLKQQPTEKGQVRITIIDQYNKYKPLGRYVLGVILTVPEHWHLYANPKQGEYGLDTEIIPQSAEGVIFGSVLYPKGAFHEDKNLNASNYIYEGQAVCYVPFELSANVTDPIPIHLDFKGLLCSDSGVCLPWQDQATFTIEPALAGAVMVPNSSDIFKDYSASIDTFPTKAPAIEHNWLYFIFLALAAGLTMNLMPCVLPIIPIIVLTLIKQCASDEQQPRRSQSIKVGLTFAAGIIVVFAGLAVLMSVFKLFWGQQFQSTAFKFVLLLIVYVLSLSMFGLYEIVLPARLTNISIVRKGYLGTLAMGMLATVLATPCGAPLLGPVITWSLAKPMPVMIAVLLITGVGMATPYVLLTAFPSLLNRIPKAGNWMILLKHAIGFAMLAFTVYLIFLFPAHWHGPLAYFCVIIGFCIWLYFRVVNHNTPAFKRRSIRVLAVVVVMIASYGLNHAVNSGPNTAVVGGDNQWLEHLNTAKENHQTVIVKFTANWCKNCAALNKLIYETDTFKQKLESIHGQLIIADGSNSNAVFNENLRRLGGPGQGLPFAAVFPANDPEHPILLRDFYSLDDVLKALDEAASR